MNKSSSICSKRLQPKASLRLWNAYTYEEIDGCYQEAKEIAKATKEVLKTFIG